MSRLLVHSFAVALAASLPPSHSFAHAEDPLPVGATQRLGSLSMRQPGGINALLFTGQGTRLLAVGTAGAIYSWDTATGESRGRFGINSRAVDGLLTNADESVFYATSMDQTVTRFRRSDLTKPEELRLPGVLPVVAPTFDRMCVVNPNGVDFDLLDAEGKLIRTLETFGLRAIEASFSDDGRFAALSTFTIPEGAGKSKRQPIVRIVDTQMPKEREEVFTFRLPEGLYFKKVRFLPGNRKLFGAGIDGMVRILDIERSLVEPVAKFGTEPASSVALSADRALAAVGDGAGHLSIFKIDGLQLLQSIEAHQSPVTAVAFSPDGKRVATGGSDSTIRIFDIETGAQVLGPKGHDTALACLSPSRDGSLVAVGTDSGQLSVWDAKTGVAKYSLTANIRAVHDAEFSPVDPILTTGGQNGEVTFFDVADGKERKRVAATDAAAMDLEYTRDGKLVYVAFANGNVYGYDPTNGELMRSIEAKSQSLVFSLAIANDGSKLAIGASAIRIVDPMGTTLLDITDCKAPVESLAFSKDDACVVAGLADGTVRVYEVASGKELRRIQHGSDRVKRVRVAPDGASILVSSESDTVAHLYDYATLEKVRTFQGHEDPLTCIAFLGADQVITGSVDTTALIWKR